MILDGCHIYGGQISEYAYDYDMASLSCICDRLLHGWVDSNTFEDDISPVFPASFDDGFKQIFLRRIDRGDPALLSGIKPISTEF